MSATYDETLPTDKDKARSLLGDTDVSPESNALFSDEHITAVLSMEGSLKGGVAYLADELIAQFAKEPTKVMTSDNGVSISVDYSKRISSWERLAAQSRNDTVGGISMVPVTYGANASDEYARPPDYWP